MSNSYILFISLAAISSISINIFFVWYLIGITRTLMFFSENLNDLLSILADYSSHVESIYELETFYGDETLHGLMLHGKDLVQELEKFEEIIYLAEETPEDEMNEREEDEYDTDEPEEPATQEEKNPAKTWVQF